MREKRKNVVFITLISILSLALCACVVLLNTKFLSDKRLDIINRTDLLEITDLKIKLKQYRDNYQQIIKIRNQYRLSLRNLVALIYNQEAPFGVGGQTEEIDSDSDEIVLLEIQNTINFIKDDQVLFYDIERYLNSRKTFIGAFPFIWPVGKNRGVPKITSGFGFREDLFGDGQIHIHEGIDISGILNDYVYATADGRVSDVAYGDKSLGNIIILNHDYGFTTGYAHLNKILVKKNQEIKRGDVIALMGNTGKTTGTHLHYEIRKDKIPLDPLNFLTVNY